MLAVFFSADIDCLLSGRITSLGTQACDYVQHEGQPHAEFSLTWKVLNARFPFKNKGFGK